MNDTTSNHPSAALPPHAQLLQMAGGFIVSRALYAAAELGLADHLQSGARTPTELAAATATNPSTLHRLLRSLAGFGIVAEDGEGKFTVTPLGAALRSDHPSHARSAIRFLGRPASWNVWGAFLHAVETGEPAASKVLGRTMFDYLADTPDEAGLFNELMIAFHGAEPAAVAKAYDFSSIGTLVDVGGGIGTLVATILLANPRLKGVLFDLPHVAAAARETLNAKGLVERCDILEGSFFDTVPEGGDAYILSHIIHDWDEASCIRILGNCRKALKGKGRVLLVEHVIPPGNESHPGKFLNLIMMTMTPGGQERTEGEYRELFRKAGFELTGIVSTESPVCVIEGRPV